MLYPYEGGDMGIGNFPVTKYGVDVVVAISGTKSAAGDMKGSAFCAVAMPAAIDGTTVKFETSIDGTNYFPVVNPDDGTEYSVPVVASKVTPVNIAYFYHARYVKAVFGTTQTAGRTVKLLGKV
jgi:hypothetical protein